METNIVRTMNILAKHESQSQETSRIKPNTFHEAICKAGIDPKGLTWIERKIHQKQAKT